MIKKFSLVFALVFVLGLGFALAASNTFFSTVGGVVDLQVSGDVTFASLIPGGSDTKNYDLIIGATNTEDLTVNIFISGASTDGPFFKNVNLIESSDTDNILTGLDASTALPLESETQIVVNINDPDPNGNSVSHTANLAATLNVPAGTLPGQRQAVIMYQVTAPTP